MDSLRMESAGSLMETGRGRTGRKCPFAPGGALGCRFGSCPPVAVTAGSPASLWWLPYIYTPLLVFAFVELEFLPAYYRCPLIVQLPCQVRLTATCLCFLRVLGTRSSLERDALSIHR